LPFCKVALIDRRQEIDPVFIGLEQRLRRSVFCEGLQHLVDAGISALGEMELLQKLSDTAVAVSPADRPELLEIVDSDGTVRSRMRQYFDAVGSTRTSMGSRVS